MKNIKIEIPKGYKIDEGKSDLVKGVIKFEKINKKITYKDVAKELFAENDSYWIGVPEEIKDPANSTTKEQLEAILELNKLCNVAKYLNGDWLPDWKDREQRKYFILIDNDGVFTNYYFETLCSHVYFKTKEAAQQAIEILGEESIRKALTLNH